MICEVWSTSIHHNDCHSNLTSLVMVSTHQVALSYRTCWASVDVLLFAICVLCVATSEFWSPQRILKPDILPSVDILLSRIIACVGTEGLGVGGFGCQRLKVSSLSQAAHQSHQSPAHINIKTMQRYKKMLCSKGKISSRMFLSKVVHLTMSA